MTATCLFFFSIGLPFVSAVKIIAPAFYSLKDTKTPVIIAFFVMIVYLSLSLVLMRPLKVGGIALALSLAEAFNFIALFIFLEKKIGRLEKKEIISSVSKSIIATGAMGTLIWFFTGMFDYSKLSFLGQLGALLATILLGILIYVLFSLFFNNKELMSLRDIFSKERILR
jgi:putative peptidoglycan lipid II flippase